MWKLLKMAITKSAVPPRLYWSNFKHKVRPEKHVISDRDQCHNTATKTNHDESKRGGQKRRAQGIVHACYSCCCSWIWAGRTYPSWPLRSHLLLGAEKSLAHVQKPHQAWKKKKRIPYQQHTSSSAGFDRAVNKSHQWPINSNNCMPRL